MMLTLLIFKLLQSPAFHYIASIRHLTNKRNVHTTTTIFLVALNYLSQVSVSLGHSLAKCPASSQRKHITSDISRGFLVII